MVFPAVQRFALLWIYLVRMLSYTVNILKHFFLIIRSSFSVQVPLSCKPLIGTSFLTLLVSLMVSWIMVYNTCIMNNLLTWVFLYLQAALSYKSLQSWWSRFLIWYYAGVFRLLQVYHMVCIIPALFNSYTCTNCLL